MKKSAKVFGLRDVGILYSQAVIQRTIDVSPVFLEHGSAKKIAVWAHANRDPNKKEVGYIFAWSGWEFWTLKIFKTKKNQKPSVIYVLFKAYPIVPLSCRSKWLDSTFKDSFYIHHMEWIKPKTNVMLQSLYLMMQGHIYVEVAEFP
jgi:hypothetical protein